MAVSTQFNGLTMPVFAAFGWAGEEQAIKFALTQLELFIARLHANLSSDLRTLFPYYGLDREAQAVYLANSEEPEESVYILFRAKPLALSITMALTDKRKLSRVFRRAEKDPEDFHKLVKYLGDNWEMHIQQMEIIDEDSEEASHYKDVFKGNAKEAPEDTIHEIVSRTHYLNSEPQWKAPVFFTSRRSSEQVATMGTGVITYLTDFMVRMAPLARFLANTATRITPKAKSDDIDDRATADKATSAMDLREAGTLDEFVYVAEVRSLHIRKGFINLTPDHWPFFSEGARSTTREVELNFGENQEETATVWRLVSNGQARIVLEDSAQHWLADAIAPNERVQVTAVKNEQEEIAITLKPVV